MTSNTRLWFIGRNGRWPAASYGPVPVVELFEPEKGIMPVHVAIVTQLRAVGTATAYLDRTGVPVGYLRWRLNTGEILMIYVKERFRRRGMATTLYRAAMSAAEFKEWMAAPIHSASRSLEYERWARSVGGRLPYVPSGARPFEALQAAGLFLDEGL